MAHCPEWVNEYMGLSYADADCWEIVGKVLERRGVELPNLAVEYGRYQGDARDWEGVEALVVRERTEWKRIEAAEPFDVALYWVTGKGRDGALGRWLGHVGVVVAPGLGLSSDHKHGAYVYPLERRLWREKLEGYYRHAALR